MPPSTVIFILFYLLNSFLICCYSLFVCNSQINLLTILIRSPFPYCMNTFCFSSNASFQEENYPWNDIYPHGQIIYDACVHSGLMEYSCLTTYICVDPSKFPLSSLFFYRNSMIHACLDIANIIVISNVTTEFFQRKWQSPVYSDHMHTLRQKEQGNVKTW